MKLRSRDLTILRLNILLHFPNLHRQPTKSHPFEPDSLRPTLSISKLQLNRPYLYLPAPSLSRILLFHPSCSSACSSPTDRTHHTYHCTTSTIRIFPRSRWLKPTNRSHNSSWCLWVMEVPERSAPASRRLGLVPPVWVV
jgi:hypothetical protein